MGRVGRFSAAVLPRICYNGSRNGKWFSDGFFKAQPSKVQTVWHLAGSVPKNSLCQRGEMRK